MRGPSSNRASLNAGALGRSPEETAIDRASSPVNIA